MKVIRTSATVVLASVALLSGALAGCSSDTGDDPSASPASPESTPPATATVDTEEFCTAAFSPLSVTTADGTVLSQSSENIEAWAEADSLSDADISLAFSAHYEGLRAVAPSSLHEDLDTVIAYHKDSGDWKNVTTEIHDASSAIGQAITQLCPPGDATD